jgi:hypothetical protein
MIWHLVPALGIPCELIELNSSACLSASIYHDLVIGAAVAAVMHAGGGGGEVREEGAGGGGTESGGGGGAEAAAGPRTESSGHEGHER